MADSSWWRGDSRSGQARGASQHLPRGELWATLLVTASPSFHLVPARARVWFAIGSHCPVAAFVEMSPKSQDTLRADPLPEVASEPEVLTRPPPSCSYQGRDGRFEVGCKLGSGGMATVYQAFDRHLQRPAALKQLHDRLSGEFEASLRFRREARLTGWLDHPNIVPVYEAWDGAQGEPDVIAMKLVEGRTLRSLIMEEDTLNSERLDQLLRVFRAVCDALAFAHSRGVVHRDVKSANVMVANHGQVYLMDWGVAKVIGSPEPAGTDAQVPPVGFDEEPLRTRGGALIGSPCYMAPEQAWGDASRIDQRTDVFALGGMLYEILTGAPPYDPSLGAAVLTEARAGRIVPPQKRAPGRVMPPELCRIAMKALSEAPEQRYASVPDLAVEIDAALRGGGWFESRTYGRGELILREGDPAGEAFIIKSGQCAVVKGSGVDRRVVRTLGPGEVFGEMGLITREPRTASIECLDAVTVAVITRTGLERELDGRGFVGLLLEALARRFRDVDAELDELRRPSSV